MMPLILTLEIHFEQDVVLARQRTRQIAKLLGFDPQDQTRLATAVSEIVRNALQYGGGGQVEFHLSEETPQNFLITIRDRGPGIPHLQAILDGQCPALSGVSSGIIASQRLMDRFQIDSVPGQGTTVVLGKPLARRSLTPLDLAELSQELVQQQPQSPLEEAQRQNQELLRALTEIRKREEELTRLNRELEETNRGVVALYAELDEKAASLHRANELKTRFLSYTSHEFRTPLNSIVSLSGFLLNRLDGELNPEQEKQVRYIRQAAEGLAEMVNDLLDLAKVEAGKIEVHPRWFGVNELFGTLRGLLRPLLSADKPVALVFEDPDDLPQLYTDEGKLAQILRNLITNALKYTDQGEVRIAARLEAERLNFAIADTGIGIAPADQTRIFEDFAQVDSPTQRRVKGTGLGLPLSRKLATLLGGQLTVQSQVGVGSTFVVTLPLIYPQLEVPTPNSVRTASSQEKLPTLNSQLSTPQPELERPTLLIIDDNPHDRYCLCRNLAHLPLQIVEVSDGLEGLELARRMHPQGIVLDLIMPQMSGLDVLASLQSDPQTQKIPVIVNTSKVLSLEEKLQLARYSVVVISKDSHTQEGAIAKMQTAITQAGILPNIT